LNSTLTTPAEKRHFQIKPIALALAALALSACSTIAPVQLSSQALLPANQADRTAMQKGVQPITGALTLDEALARALKYNLERRAKMMEEALAFNQLDVSHFDMLPRLVAQAGYAVRNNDRISQSRNTEDGTLSPSRFVSQDRAHEMLELGFTWNLLDYSLGYYGTRQQADRVLIASERRRKAMHVLMQDVRTAFWRAASAQKLRDEVNKTIAMAEDALVDSRKAEAERVRNPIDALRYQRQLLENLRLLESIDQELSSAQVELATLVNAPIGQPIVIVESDANLSDASVLKVTMQAMEEAALAQNADLREQHYNARIAREETRRTLVRLFPNVSFSYGIKYDSDTYLVNRNWNEAGLQFTFNLFNLMTGPTQIKLAEAGVALADQRRVATQLAVLSQVHLARLQLLNARNQFERADAIYATDVKISELVRNRETAQAQSKLDSVSNATAAILSLLRRYQALAQVQAAENRLLANLGMEPKIGSTGELSLEQLTDQVKRDGNPWRALLGDASSTPAPVAPVRPAPAEAPKVVADAAPINAQNPAIPATPAILVTRSAPDAEPVLALISTDELSYVPFDPSRILAATLPQEELIAPEQVSLQAKAGS
jgi:outer membrane protein TolC